MTDVASLAQQVTKLAHEVASVRAQQEVLASRLLALEGQNKKLMRIVEDVIGYNNSLQEELKNSLRTCEESLLTIKSTMNLITEQQGRLIREVHELAGGE